MNTYSVWESCGLHHIICLSMKLRRGLCKISLITDAQNDISWLAALTKSRDGLEAQGDVYVQSGAWMTEAYHKEEGWHSIYYKMLCWIDVCFRFIKGNNWIRDWTVEKDVRRIEVYDLIWSKLLRIRSGLLDLGMNWKLLYSCYVREYFWSYRPLTDDVSSSIWV